MTSDEHIQHVADEAAIHCFVAEWIKEDTLEIRQEEGLGIRIAHWSRWDGYKIMRVFRAALEDANYHTEAEIISEWIKAEKEIDK